MADFPDTAGCAFVFVDFQRDFCHRDGYMGRGQCDMQWAEAIIPPARRLLELARKSGATVVHTREGYASDLSDVTPAKFRQSELHGARIGDRGPLGRYLIRGEYGHDFIDLMQPEPGELVVDKSSYSAFCRTTLDEDLRARGIETLILAGVTADVCVHSTMRDAVDRGFSCVYVRDAISTPDSGLRLACEKMVSQEGGIWGRLSSVDELCG